MYIRDNNIDCEVIELLFNDILTKLYVHSNEVVSRILVRIANLLLLLVPYIIFIKDLVW